MSGPFELVGDDDAGVCEDGVCALPDAPHAPAGDDPAADDPGE